MSIWGVIGIPGSTHLCQSCLYNVIIWAFNAVFFFFISAGCAWLLPGSLPDTPSLCFQQPNWTDLPGRFSLQHTVLFIRTVFPLCFYIMFSHCHPYEKRIISRSRLSVRYCVDKQSTVIRFLMSAAAWLSINHHCTVSVQCSAVNCRRDSSAPHRGVSHYRWRRVKRTWMHQDLKSRPRYCDKSIEWSELNSWARLGKRNYALCRNVAENVLCVTLKHCCFVCRELSPWRSSPYPTCSKTATTANPRNSPFK